MGIGTLGFLKGASKVALDSIDAREEAERELKKQQQLEKFRADLRQKQEMATATTWLREDRADGKSYLVGLNSQGQRVPGAEREEAADEAAARKYKGTLDTLTIKDKEQNIEKGGVDIENTRDTIRSRREDDRRAAELARSQAGYYDRGNRPTSKVTTTNKTSLSEVLDGIMTRNDKAITELSAQENVPLSTIKEGAWKFAELSLAKGDSPLTLERNFSKYLQYLRVEARKRGLND